MNINDNLTESDIHNIDIKSSLEHQIQKFEMKDSGWRLDANNSMTVCFYKTTEMNGSGYVKNPLTKPAILNIENKDEHCFIWSILASLQPKTDSKKEYSTRVSIYRQNFNELNIQGFVFSNGFYFIDAHKLEKKKLSINMFELSFCPDQNEWKYKLIPIEASKNESDKIVDILIHKKF